MKLEDVKKLGARIKENIGRVIVGKDDVVELVVISLLCSGHVLLEDVPGVGKTVLAKSLAKSVACGFKRVQFTPDLLPSDLTGVNYFNQKAGDFIFRPGPLFTNILLADEINRATPRTQASLLECMEEKQASVDGETRLLEAPFFVIATQNPIETQGTFPLPEAQLDRFFMKLQLGYPGKEEGIKILGRFKGLCSLPDICSITDGKEVSDAQASVVTANVNDAVMEYIIDITEATRKHEKAALGVSPRGSLALMKAVQAYAVMQGRNYATPADVKRMAPYVLSHRIIPKGKMLFAPSSSTASAIIADILESTTAPVEDSVLQEENAI